MQTRKRTYEQAMRGFENMEEIKIAPKVKKPLLPGLIAKTKKIIFCNKGKMTGLILGKNLILDEKVMQKRRIWSIASLPILGRLESQNLNALEKEERLGKSMKQIEALLQKHRTILKKGMKRLKPDVPLHLENEILKTRLLCGKASSQAET